MLGPADEPVAGATVRLEPGEGTGDAVPPEPVVTGSDGRWSFVLLAPGAWRVTVEAQGFQPADGRIAVPAGGPGTSTTIRLRSLDELSPEFAESDPAGSVQRWLARGDALLEQGRPGRARTEYLRALRTPGVLSSAQRSQVLETVARTHFLEGDREAAARALRAAVVLDPAAERPRRLLATLLEQAGRSGEAERFFERLERQPATVRAELEDLLAFEREEPPALELPERPVLPPEPHRTGAYRTRFAGKSPLSSVEVFIERYGATREGIESWDPAGGAYDPAGETFEVVVPESYAPGGAGWGLLVWMSPTPNGGIESPDLREVLAEERFLWVGANRAGNRRLTWNRAGLALDAAAAMERLYDVDPERIYAAGYSGGGRMASALAILYPEVFRGALALFGVDFYRPVPVPDRPGAHWPASFAEPPRAARDLVKREGRFVLLTGERDFNRAQTRAVHREMEAAGFEHAVLIDLPAADHYHRLTPGELRRALESLEGR